MDGSEPGDTLSAAVLSGAPTDLQARTVRYEPQNDPIHQRIHMLTFDFTESSVPQSLPLNPVAGTRTTGVWTGIFSRRVTDGRTR